MCFPLNIADDLAFEKTEEFSLVLVDVSEDDNIQLHIDTLAIHIRDDDSECIRTERLPESALFA